MRKRISISLLFSKSKSYFFKLFIYISISIIILISITAYSISRSYNDQLFNTINISNQKLLYSVTYDFDYLNNYISSLLSAIYAYNSTEMLIYSKNPDTFTLNNAFVNLSNSVYNLPFVKSIYIYSGASKNFYCISGYPVVRTPETMYDTEIVEIVNKHRVKIATPFPRLIPSSDYEPHHKIEVYTYILYTVDPSTKETVSAVILNIDARWLMGNLISQIKGIHEDSTVIVANTDGLVFAHTDENQFMSSIAKNDYFKKILQEVNDSGYFVKDFGGMGSVITYNRQDSPGLVFISATSLKKLHERINTVMRITIGIAVILLLVSIITAYLISRKFYIPIKNLRKNMFSIIGLNPETAKRVDEFTVMNSMCNQAAQKISDLENFTHSNIGILKNQFILNLLSAAPSSEEEAASKIEQLHVGFNSSKPMVLVIFKESRYKDGEKNLRNENYFSETEKDFMDHVASVFQKGNFNGEVVNTSPGYLTAILNSDLSSYDELMEALKLHVGQILNDALCRQKQLSVSISRIFRKLANISPIYSEAIELIQYSFVEGTGCILVPEHFNEIRSENLIFPLKHTNELLDALKVKKLENAQQAHQKIIEYLSEFSLENIKYGLTYLTMMVFNMMNTIENNSSITFEIQHSQFNKKINQLETLHEVNAAFDELYRHIADKLLHKKNPKTDSTIEEIKAYIESHHMDSNLSLNSVADKFGYSPAYLGKIFNKVSGFSLTSYINEARLARASAMLKETKLTIEEILQAIGWESIKYFFTVFKKKFGVTPNEYRLSNCKVLNQAFLQPHEKAN